VVGDQDEWLGLLNVSGLQLEALHGGFAGEPFTDDSQEYVFVARSSSPRARRGRAGLWPARADGAATGW